MSAPPTVSGSGTANDSGKSRPVWLQCLTAGLLAASAAALALEGANVGACLAQGLIPALIFLGLAVVPLAGYGPQKGVPLFSRPSWRHLLWAFVLDTLVFSASFSLLVTNRWPPAVRGPLAGCLAAACLADRVAVLIAVAQGEMQRRKGNRQRAIAAYSQAIRIAPHSPLAWFNRGEIFLAQRAFDPALADLTEALRLAPRSASCYYWRGVAQEQSGNYDRALADLTEAIRLDPQCAAFFDQRGFIYFEKGEYDRAIADCTEAIRRNPTYATYYFGRGRSYSRQTQWTLALTDMNEAIRLDPFSPDFYEHRAEIYRAVGDAPRARQDEDRAEELRRAAAGR